LPVSKLPPEILSKVFEFREYEFVLVTATHVCRYWRSALITSPSLWTCFRFRSRPNLDRAITYLERSKSALIDVTIDVDRSRSLVALKYLAPHIARMRSLIIYGCHENVRSASLLFCSTSPTLQHLRIFSSGGLVRLPDDFLGQRAPSLSSVSFSNICLTFESLFPLLNLVQFELFLREDASTFHIGALFRFLSGCPLLQKVRIDSEKMPQDVALDQVILLESLVELVCTCDPVGRIIPYLRLPRLRRLRVSSSFGSQQTQKLSDLLPHGGHVLLAGATEMSYCFDNSSQSVELHGREVDISLTTFRTAEGLPADWFFDETCIPFGQIETLIVTGFVAVDFPDNLDIFKNLRLLEISSWNAEFTEESSRLLYPNPGAEIPCQSLRRIHYTYDQGSPNWSLVGLVRERKRAGHQLGLLRLSITYGCRYDEDIVEELKEHVGEVQITW